MRNRLNTFTNTTEQKKQLQEIPVCNIMQYSEGYSIVVVLP